MIGTLVVVSLLWIGPPLALLIGGIVVSLRARRLAESSARLTQAVSITAEALRSLTDQQAEADALVGRMHRPTRQARTEPSSRPVPSAP